MFFCVKISCCLAGTATVTHETRPDFRPAPPSRKPVRAAQSACCLRKTISVSSSSAFAVFSSRPHARPLPSKLSQAGPGRGYHAVSTSKNRSLIHPLGKRRQNPRNCRVSGDTRAVLCPPVLEAASMRISSAAGEANPAAITTAIAAAEATRFLFAGRVLLGTDVDTTWLFDGLPFLRKRCGHRFQSFLPQMN